MPKALAPLPKASSSLRQLRLLLADFDEAQLAATLAFARAIAKSPQDEAAVQRVSAALSMLWAQVRPHPEDPNQLLVEGQAAPRLATRGAYRLSAQVLGTKPPVTRRLLLPGDLNLGGLNLALRLSLGWPSEGPFRFLVDGAPYGRQGEDDELLPPERTALDDLLLAPGQDFRWVCHLPEGAWALRLRVVACLPPEACVGRPALEGGQRPAPPWRWGRPHGPGAPGLIPLEANPRVDWRSLRAAFAAAPWAAHRRPWRLGEADPIHGLLRG